jgi:putative transposase
LSAARLRHNPRTDRLQQPRRLSAFIERWFRTLKEEAVWLTEYRDFDEARQDIERYIRFYNTERLHSALGYRSPAEYRAYLAQQTAA